MFSLGNIVRFQSPQAGKEKFHLCVRCASDGLAGCFLFLNSGSGYKGSLILDDGEIDGLPNSPTGNTVVSFSQSVRMREDQLTLFSATKTGEISASTAGVLLAHARTVPTLSLGDRKIVIEGLEVVTELFA